MYMYSWYIQYLAIVFITHFYLYVELEDWSAVMKECGSLAAIWRELSIYLGLSHDVIDNIKGSGDNYHCWSEALRQWIGRNYNTKKFGVPSWRSFLRVVAKADRLLFKNLARQHQGMLVLHCMHTCSYDITCISQY